ncbi:MAG TPA: phasin family protein [Usitatibacter sp.]|nr:phasin family protein [Usitatibacter sp.]
MAARKHRTRARPASRQEPGAAIADSAQKIWLAGLGAFERARAEGPKMFDVLVREGRSVGGKARDAADQALKGLRDGSTLARLQSISGGDVGELTRQVRELGETVKRLALPPRRAPRKAAAKRGAVKRKVKRVVRSARRTATRASVR